MTKKNYVVPCFDNKKYKEFMLNLFMPGGALCLLSEVKNNPASDEADYKPHEMLCDIMIMRLNDQDINRGKHGIHDVKYMRDSFSKNRHTVGDKEVNLDKTLRLEVCKKIVGSLQLDEKLRRVILRELSSASDNGRCTHGFVQRKIIETKQKYELDNFIICHDVMRDVYLRHGKKLVKELD